MPIVIMFRFGWFVDIAIAIDYLNGLKEHNNWVQNTEPPESRIVLNRLPSDTWSLWGFNLFYLDYKFSGRRCNYIINYESLFIRA